jgi:hypothetical protein
MKLVKCGQLEAFGQECSNFITGGSHSFHVRNAVSRNCTKFPGKKLESY